MSKKCKSPTNIMKIVLNKHFCDQKKYLDFFLSLYMLI
jgi:hypothetical protein